MEYRCPTHKTDLAHVLKGGAGYCGDCRFYVQADGIPMPILDRPAVVTKPKRQRKAAKKKSRKKTASRRETAR